MNIFASWFFFVYFLVLLSKQLQGNFNVTGGKTTHDMNGVWWDKHSIVKSWAILSLPKLPLEGSSDHQSHCSPMTQITQHITICTELFFSSTQILLFLHTFRYFHIKPQLTFKSWCGKTTCRENILCCKYSLQMFAAILSFASYFNSALNPPRQEKLC